MHDIYTAADTDSSMAAAAAPAGEMGTSTLPPSSERVEASSSAFLNRRVRDAMVEELKQSMDLPQDRIVARIRQLKR